MSRALMKAVRGHFAHNPNGVGIGSINGTATLDRTYLTQLSAAHDLPEGIQDAAVFPNPAADHLTIALTAKDAATAKIQLVNTSGQTVWSGSQLIQEGLNVLGIKQLPALPCNSPAA